MIFTQVKYGVLYSFESGCSFWITEKAGRIEACVWRVTPQPSTDPIHIDTFGKIEDAIKYLENLASTLKSNFTKNKFDDPILIKNALNELLTNARLSMIRDGSGRGNLKIEKNLDVSVNPCDRFIYDYKHDLDNINAGINEHNEYLRLKAKYEGTK